MLAPRSSPNCDDDIDVLLLDWSFLRIPLESLSTSVRQMHKVIDADAVRLTAFHTRQFSSSSSAKLSFNSHQTDSAANCEAQSEAAQLQPTAPAQRRSTLSNGDASRQSQSTAASRVAALEDLEKRYKETLRAMDKVSEFVQKMRNRAQTHFSEIDKYLIRCDCRINLITRQDNNSPSASDWPSPQTIASLSSITSNSTSVPTLLIRRTDSINHNGKVDEQMRPIESTAAPKSIFALMTKRIDVLVHHYLCRNGFMKTAEHLKSSQDLEHLVDTEVYESAATIIKALQLRDASPALAWCGAHKSKLRKLQNNLEIQLRLQETISMILRGNSHEAMNYLRSNVSANDAASCLNIRPVLSLLAFVNSTGAAVTPSQWFSATYTPLFDPQRWVELIEMFRESVNSVYEICRRAPLEVLLQSGFSALMTKSCSQSLSPSCPSCDPLWNPYFQIPSSHHIRSYIVCPIKGHIMGDEDPPLASPDGLVFSTSAVNELAKHSVDGKIEAPYSDSKYPIDRFHRLYIT